MNIEIAAIVGGITAIFGATLTYLSTRKKSDSEKEISFREQTLGLAQKLQTDLLSQTELLKDQVKLFHDEAQIFKEQVSKLKRQISSFEEQVQSLEQENKSLRQEVGRLKSLVDRCRDCEHFKSYKSAIL